MMNGVVFIMNAVVSAMLVTELATFSGPRDFAAILGLNIVFGIVNLVCFIQTTGTHD